MMCECMNVSRAGYYKFLKCEPSVRSQENEALVEEIKAVHKESRKSYGSPRVHAELVARGFEVNKKRIARLMAEEGIVGRRKGRFKNTTDSNHDDPIAPNLLNREFEVERPDTAWVADVTYVWTVEGWLYLAVIIDLFSRKVVGWSIADHMRTTLVLDALKAALGRCAGRPVVRSPGGSDVPLLVHRGQRDSVNHAVVDRDALRRVQR